MIDEALTRLEGDRPSAPAPALTLPSGDVLLVIVPRGGGAERGDDRHDPE